MCTIAWLVMADPSNNALAVHVLQRDEAEKMLEELHVASLAGLGATHGVTEAVRALIEVLRDDFVKLAHTAR